MDLADPQWKGKIAIAGAETDFQPIVTSIVRAHGEAAALQWLEAVKANAGSHSYPDNETVTREVNSGQVAWASSTSTTGTVRKPRSGSRVCTRPSPTSPRTTPGT